LVATDKPLYQASETSFDPQLLGIWSVPAEAGKPSVLIIARGDGKSYRFTSVPDSGGSSGTPDEMDLVRLGKYEYFFCKVPQVSGTVLFPAYRVRVSGREMHMSLLNGPQFLQELKDHPGMLTYTEQPVRYPRPATEPSSETRPIAASQPTTWPSATNVVLTDPPEKIRRLLIQHEDDPNWFAEVLVLHRLTPPMRR
jgi:hypothetical protein